ncbi:MAG TPA: DUF1398 family protein [Chitinophagaceae bacterium]|nr:DUF1398 family protein [Chitinophagaceae bacterium]
MFTINEIKEAHAKVKSGADYPAYVQALIKLGVTGYSTFLYDGHTVYYGENNYSVQTLAGTFIREIAAKSENDTFIACLQLHQQGLTDYPTFCSDAAAAGVEKWVVDLAAMTCTYYGKAGNKMLEESIPEA